MKKLIIAALLYEVLVCALCFRLGMRYEHARFMRMMEQPTQGVASNVVYYDGSK